MLTAEKQQSSSTHWTVVLWSAFAAFTTYFCMYGFRKPLTAATFDGQRLFGLPLKSVLVIAQVLGYMGAKFIGIKFISEVKATHRGRYILILIGAAHLSLLLLALIPFPFAVLFMFTNGLSLGLIWGLVFSFIEGRRFTDFLALVLSTNFIFSSGVAKTVGRLALQWPQVTEKWMPFVAGAFYIPLLLLSVGMLTRIPARSEAEVSSRGTRTNLTGSERRGLLTKFLVGMVAITLINLFLTILRDVKDNFGVEILRSVKPDFNAGIFSRMDTFSAITVLLLLLLLTGIRSHFKSLIIHHGAIFAGFISLLLSAYGLVTGNVNPVWCLIIYTIGLYLCYNTLQCLFLDRFMAAFKVRGNIGFFFYFMDSIGYLGSCVVIIMKEFTDPHANWLHYFISVSFALGIAGLICTVISIVYFRAKYHSEQELIKLNYEPAAL